MTTSALLDEAIARYTTSGVTRGYAALVDDRSRRIVHFRGILVSMGGDSTTKEDELAYDRWGQSFQ